MRSIIISLLIVAVAAKEFAPLSDEIVEHVNSLKTSWTAEKNKFHSWNLAAFKKTLGARGKQSKKSEIKETVEAAGLLEL